MSHARRHPPSAGDAGPDAPIAPLIPPDRPRPRPAVLGVAALAPQQPGTPDPDVMVLDVARLDVARLDVARLDASGRFTSRALLRMLGWAAGHRIGLQVRADAVVFTEDPAGPLAVGSRGELAIPGPARTMAGLNHNRSVVLLAIPARSTLIVHPPHLVTALLAAHHAHTPGNPS
jgi:hypothetical protein